MSAPQLRLFSDARHSDDVVIPTCTANSVAVNVGEIVPLLLDAARNNRAWLTDFADETLEISQDLYEVLVAYKRIADENQPVRRRAAA